MMRWMMVAGAALAIGCGSDGGNGGNGGTTDGGGTGDDGLPAVSLAAQEEIGEAAWTQTVSEQTDLKVLVEAAAADGLTTWVDAGIARDAAGTTVTWGVLSNGADQERTLAVGCDADGACRAAAIAVSNGQAVFTGPDGATVEPLMIAAPVMLKDLEGTDHEGKTTLASALTADEVPPVNLMRRRFVLANAFGDVFGVTYGSVAQMARDSGAFTEVVDAQYVDRSLMEDVIGASSPMDVLVWVGAAVREQVGNQHKTIGMTVNRGVYGDETFRARRVRELLKLAPYGGPGLVLLVAEQSRGDGSQQETEPLSLVGELAELTAPQVVVGFSGRGKPADLLDAGRVFLKAFFEGATLAGALDAGNALLEERGSAALLVSNKTSTAEQITFVGNLDAFWEGGDPSEVRSNHYLNISNVCIPEQGQAYNEPEGQANFFVDVTFDGPFFSGTRTWEQSDQQLSATVEGVLTGTDLGDRVYLKFSGDVKPSVKGITVWGIGQFVEPKGVDKPPEGRIYYDGTAVATDYTNDQGDTCTLKSPTLSGSTDAQKSWLQLPTEQAPAS